MENIEKVIKGLRTEVLARFSNHFIASFYIAVSVINWEIYLIIFSGDLKTTEKIALVLSKIHSTKLFWYPLLVSAGYVLFAPVTAVISNFIWGFARQKINNIHRYFDERSYLSIEKSLKLKIEMYEYDKKYLELFKESTEIRKEYQNEISSRESTIADLKAKAAQKESDSLKIEMERDSLIQQLNDLREKFPVLPKPKLEANLEQILRFLANSQADVYDMHLARHLKIPEQKVRYHIDKLKEMKFVNEVVGKYSLTPQGRKYYFENLENK